MPNTMCLSENSKSSIPTHVANQPWKARYVRLEHALIDPGENHASCARLIIPLAMDVATEAVSDLEAQMCQRYANSDRRLGSVVF